MTDRYASPTSMPGAPIGISDDDPTGSEKPPGLTTSVLDRWVLSWGWELGACLGAVLSLVAILLILHLCEGKPFPTLPFDISINALISVFAVIYKTTILFALASCFGQLQWSWFSRCPRPLLHLVKFDDASRGPWGSLDLIWSQRLKQPLAVLGALVMVASVAVDPFIQELALSEDCSIPMAGQSAQLPRTNVFSRGMGMENLYNDLRTYINQGLYGVEGVSHRQCSTGNCTFEDTFSTVGYCSLCQDVSSKIVVSKDPHQYAFASHPGEWPYSEYMDDFWNTSVESSLPWGVSVSFNPTDAAVFGTFRIDESKSASVAPTLQAGLSKQGETVVDIMFGANTWTASAINPVTGQYLAECAEVESRRAWACAGFGAATCTFKPCVRTYNATITAGRLSEHLVDVADVPWGLDESYYYDDPQLGERDHWFYGLVDLPCTNLEARDDLSRLGYHVDHVPEQRRWLPVNVSADYAMLSPSTPSFTSTQADGSSSTTTRRQTQDLVYRLLKDKCLYLMDNVTPWDLKLYLSYTFEGTIKGSNEGANADGIPMQNVRGSPLLLHLYNGGAADFARIDAVFASMAESLTRHIRTGGNATHSEPALGQTLHYAACLRVNWPWIAYPAALLALTLLLLACVIIAADRRRLPLWKASPLAWQFRGPGGGGGAGGGLAEAVSSSSWWSTQPSSCSSSSSRLTYGGGRHVDLPAPAPCTLEAMERESEKIQVFLGDVSDPRVDLVGKTLDHLLGGDDVERDNDSLEIIEP